MSAASYTIFLLNFNDYVHSIRLRLDLITDTALFLWLIFLLSEKRLLDYGESPGDVEVTQLSSLTGERVSPLIVLPQGLPLFAGQIYNSLYVSQMGNCGLKCKNLLHNIKSC